MKLKEERKPMLMELESSIGFRSSFNFIPEGDYSTPKELRDHLTANGFEVGVHDLKHDGKLYRSRNAFKAHADRINHYLKEWNAVGFRSGFMHHNLDWLHDLKHDGKLYRSRNAFKAHADRINHYLKEWNAVGFRSGFMHHNLDWLHDL